MLQDILQPKLNKVEKTNKTMKRNLNIDNKKKSKLT